MFDFMEDPFVLLHVVLFASIFELYAAIDDCNRVNMCDSNHAWAMLAGTVSIICCITMLVMVRCCVEHVSVSYDNHHTLCNL